MDSLLVSLSLRLDCRYVLLHRFKRHGSIEGLLDLGHRHRFFEGRKRLLGQSMLRPKLRLRLRLIIMKDSVECHSTKAIVLVGITLQHLFFQSLGVWGWGSFTKGAKFIIIDDTKIIDGRATNGLILFARASLTNFATACALVKFISSLGGTTLLTVDVLVLACTATT